MMQQAILIGLTAFVLIELLMPPFEAFGWFPPLLRRALFGTSAIRDYENYKWWQLLIYKPLAGCAKCCAGWLEIGYLIYSNEIFNIPYSIFFVVVAIASAWLATAAKERMGLMV